MAETRRGADGLTERQILDDPSASEALKKVLRDWQGRDIVDAANDAAVLQSICQTAVLRRLGLRP